MLTERAILVVGTVILEAVDLHCGTGFIFVDLRKAFDSLPISKTTV